MIVCFLDFAEGFDVSSCEKLPHIFQDIVLEKHDTRVLVNSSSIMGTEYGKNEFVRAVCYRACSIYTTTHKFFDKP